MDISVIIVNYNTCKVTCECLDSIFKYSKDIEFEVIVVDNDSTRDNSKNILSQYPGIKYVQSNENIGFGKANNLGFSYSKGDLILLLNSDTYLINNALKIFVDRFKTMDSSIGCIGSILLSPDMEPVNSYNNFHSIKSSIQDTYNAYLNKFSFKVKQTRSGTKGVNMVVPYIVGADLCIRRSVIEECELFDPDFFMYYEDVELQKRYLRNGYHSFIIDGPKIVHLECVSSKGTSSKASFFHKSIYLQGQLLYYKKVYPIWQYFLWRLFFVSNIPFFVKSWFSVKENLFLLKLFLL